MALLPLLFHGLLTVYRHEFRAFTKACFASPLYKKAIAEFDLPEGFVVTIDPVSHFAPSSADLILLERAQSLLSLVAIDYFALNIFLS
jgi:hypothetical protein